VLTLSAKLSTCGISIQYILNRYQWQIHNIETTVKIEVKMLVQMKFFLTDLISPHTVAIMIILANLMRVFRSQCKQGSIKQL